MYRGLARLVGMDTPALEGSVEDEITFLKKKYNDQETINNTIKAYLSGKDVETIVKEKTAGTTAKKVKEIGRAHV